MYEMRMEENRETGSAALWHVVGKGSLAPLCGSEVPTGNPCGSEVEATERYCAPCIQAFSLAVAAGRSA